MAEANWYWADGDQRNGPVAPAAIARLVADGKLGPDDLIWKEGMPDWIPVRKVPALMKYAKAPAAVAAPMPVTVAAPIPVESNDDTNEMPAVAEVEQPVHEDEEAEVEAPQPLSATEAVSYYNPSGSMPPRAAATLAKHATPRGDVGDWPLDDARVVQFEQALKLRKKIDSAASLFKLMLLLMAIADVAFIIAAVVAFVGARGPSATGAAVGVSVGAAACLGFTVLYYFAGKATARSHSWAPLTMGILFVIGGLLQVVSIVMGTASISSSGGTTPIVALAILSLLFSAIFAYVAFNAFFAIPKYLLQPAWCQELLSKTGQK